MLQLCSYETHALGYSAFCDLFSQEDFLNYEYYYDLVQSRPLTAQVYLGQLIVPSPSITTTVPALRLQL